MFHVKFVEITHQVNIMAFLPATVVPDSSRDPSEEIDNIGASPTITLVQ